MTNTILPSNTLPLSCNRDCGAGCPLAAVVSDGRITEIRDNPLRPADMSGCVRGYKYGETVYHRERLRTPLIRTGERGSGRFREASWDEALEYTAEKLSSLLDRFGSRGILNLGGSGSCRGAVHNTSRLPRRFFNLLGGYTGTDGNYSQRAVMFAMPYLFGTDRTGFDPATLSESRLIILWGANISDTRFGPQLEYRVRAARDRGVPVVVIDPRKSRTFGRCGTDWIPIYPGTDGALMCALIWELLERGLSDREFLESCCRGSREIVDMVRGKLDGVTRDSEWAEKICGIPAERIQSLAELYGRTKPAALIPGLSIQRTVGGEETSRLAVALQAFTGNIGVPGGSSGGACWGALPVPGCASIPLEENDHTVRRPVYTWAEWVLSGSAGGYPSDIRALYNVGGNYIIQGSDIRKNIEAFLKVDFSVCHEIFLTPTARYCDVIFPVSVFPERRDILTNGSNYLFYSERAAEAPGGVKDDYKIFSHLAGKLGIGEEFTRGRSGDEWVDWCIAHSEIDDPDSFRRTGLYDGGDHRRTAFTAFRKDPNTHPLGTESGRIELVSRRYERETGFPAVPVPRIFDDHKDGRYPLRLVTPHARNRVNSQNSNTDWCRKLEKPAVQVGREEASARGFTDGEEVEVVSPFGSLQTRIEISEDIMSGVVSILQGSWPEADESGLYPRDNPNYCTSTEPTRPSGGSRTHSTRVEIRKLHKGNGR